MKAKVTPALDVTENSPLKSCMNGGNLQGTASTHSTSSDAVSLAMPPSSWHHHDQPLSKRRMEFRLRYGSHQLNKTDRAPLHFWPAYGRKIHHGLKFAPTARYQKIATFLNDLKMTDEAKWFEKRNKKINPSSEGE